MLARTVVTRIIWRRYPEGTPSTLFIHQWYTDYDQYPDDVADGVGYWAEARILGGVVVSDRRDPETYPEANPHDIYFHSDRDEVTYRLYALLDEQKQQLLEFLCAESADVEKSPLPILGDANNRKRVDPEEEISRTGIYRDLWERKLRHPDQDRRRARKRIMDTLNYTSWEEFQAAVRRGRDAENEWIMNHEE